MPNASEIERLLSQAKKELEELDAKRTEIVERIRTLEDARGQAIYFLPSHDGAAGSPTVSAQSPPEKKVALFRSLFRGREDVYARRFESARSGRSGYQPACANEWTRPLCKKPQVKCADCEHREFIPVTDNTIRNHLLGRDPDSRSNRDFTVGVYPMLPDETCQFLAVDFDKSTWAEDARAYLETCTAFNVPAALERSRSGNGGHVWMFFS
ncbi:restriction endonuclease subunit R, partial [candidate division BRC1 bacterium SM23_51]